MNKSMLRKKLPRLYFYHNKYRIQKTINKYKNCTVEEMANELKKIYKERIGRELNLENPQAYTEKIQWSKLYGSDNALKARLSDKYLVREFVSEIIGKEYLIPLLGVWDRFEDIDFQTLPEQFVLKTNNGSGTNIIVKSKRTLDYKFAKNKFDFWMSIPFGFQNAFQLHYNLITPKIICEEFMFDNEHEDLLDYKFLCFNGDVKAIWVDIDRSNQHTRNIYDVNWNLLPWRQAIPNYNGNVPKPSNLAEMIEIAKKLSSDIPHVRVDLYNINSKIYFGEMTFTNGSGLDKIYPDEYDFVLGKYWQI